MEVVLRPYRGGSAVTPDDTTLLAPTRGLYIGGAGNITVDMADGSLGVVFTALPVGTLLPISVIRVKATGTTATAIVAMN